jgi:hypothetical protein
MTIDMGLIGLLTYASQAGGLLSLAITVAGQWRIYTALPVHQTEKFISGCSGNVKRRFP